MIFLGGGGEMVVVVKPLTVSFFKTFSILSMCVLKYLVFYKKKIPFEPYHTPPRLHGHHIEIVKSPNLIPPTILLSMYGKCR